MNKERELRAVRRREQRIDEALQETFPASDTPSFVGAGAPTHDKTMNHSRLRSAGMAGDAVDRHTDPSASPEEQQSRKRQLLKGPKEFRNLRRD